MTIMQRHIRKAIALYRNGLSVAAVASQLGFPETAINKALKSTKAVDLRSRGRPAGWTPPEAPPTAEEWAMRQQTLRQISTWDERRMAALDELAAYHGWKLPEQQEAT